MVKRRGRQTGREPLTREAILSAALGLVDREGLDILTMRRLGAEVGVEAMSLYNYVPNKAALLDGLHEAIMAEMTLPALDGDWGEQLAAAAIALRRVLLAHPHALPLFATRSAASPGSLRLVDKLLGTLRLAGFRDLQAIYAFNGVMTFVIGHALAEVDRPLSNEEQGTPYDPLQGLPPTEFPNVMAAGRAFRAHDPTAEFDFALAAMITGLRQILAGLAVPQA